MTSTAPEKGSDATGAGPRIARWLLLSILPGPDAEAIVGDIEEGYAGGRSRAWYWFQALGSLISWWRRSLRAGALGHDVRLALRKLGRRPGFSVVVVLTLALGIGASAAVFSVVDGVLLSPLPYPDPERLVAIRAELTRQATRPPLAPQEFVEVSRAASLEAVGGIWYRPAALTDDASEPEDIDMAFVTAGLLPTFGVPPLLGRHPLPEEDVDGGEPVIVLSEHLWKRRYGADPDIVGKRIEMDDQPHTVVGVMAAAFEVHLPPDVRTPQRVDAWVTFGGGYETFNRNFRIFTVIGRLRPDATRVGLNTELAAIAAAAREQDEGYGGTGYELRGEALDTSVVATARPVLMLLLGAVGLVLLIVCANVANLFLARAAETRRDIAMRRALGATRARLLRGLAVECAMVTGLGAVLGVLVARWAIAAMPLLAPADLPRIGEVALDLRVVGFATLIAAATALAFAAVSGIEVRRGSGASSLRAAGRATGTVSSTRTRGALLVAELALSLMLLIGVGLMVRSFANLADVDHGFDPEDVVTVKMSLVDTHFTYAEPRKIADFYGQVGRQVAALAGVEAAGITTYLPALSLSMSPYAYETAEGVTQWGSTVADRRHVTPGWMEAMGARLLAGRFFDWRDDLDHPNVVVVDDKLATMAWPGENALGKRLRVMVFLNGVQNPVWAEVVGVVQHMRHDPAHEGAEQVFIPHAQSPMRTTVLTIRTSDEMPALGDEVGAIVRRLDGDQPVGTVLPMSTYLDATVASLRFALTLMTVFSALALVLAIVGTYGVISYGVAQRTREIGIQMAIGASPADVVRAIVVGGAKLAVLGVILGMVGAAGLGRFLGGMLYDVAPTDPATFGMLGVLLMLVTMLACYLPARRAARLDPTLTLRAE